MKLQGNILSGAKLALTVLKMNKYKGPLERAKAKGDFPEERRILAEACSEWINLAMEKFDLSFEVTGQENIPAEPFVIIANHQAYCDIPAVIKAMEGHQIGFIAREGFKPVPILSTWILRLRGLFIPTGTDTRESLKVISDGVALLKDGFNLAIFPEGKRSWGSDMNEFKAGSFKLATKAKVPILPVAIEGTYQMFEEHEKITGGKTAKVRILPPIDTANLDRAQQKELPEKVHALIQEAVLDMCKSN